MPEDRIILLDGAMGTTLWNKTGDKRPVWQYNIEKPDMVVQAHKEYIEAGAEIILANTFCANRMSVEGSPYTVEEIVSAGVRLAKAAINGTDVRVALSAGPLPMLLESYGNLSKEEAKAQYEQQLQAGMKEGADIIMLETFMDQRMLEIAAVVAKQYGVPILCSMSFDKSGKTLVGDSVQSVIDTLTPLGIDAIGINCSLGPEQALPIIKEFSDKTDLPLIFKPNAGLPKISEDGSTEIPYDAHTFIKNVLPALGFVTYIGGCCGTDASYIRQLKNAINDMDL